MKKYKLLKDLPTFKAGEIFSLEGGNLYYYPADNGTKDAHWSDKIMAYHHKTLDKFPNIIEEWFEEIKEPKEYWYIGYKNIVRKADEPFNSGLADDGITQKRKEIGNYFETEEEAANEVIKEKGWDVNDKKYDNIFGGEE